MKPKQYKKIKAIFSDALKLEPDAIPAYLDQSCENDDEIRQEVESLLVHDGRMDSFLNAPIVEKLSKSNIHNIIKEVEIPLPKQIGSYKILDRLGIGGMGIVYKAQQERPQRIVALKMIKPEIASAHRLKRFEYEAEVLARLQHPGIAQVFEVGTVETDTGPQPFFAMELVEGLTATRYVQKKNISTNECLELLAKICDAIHHAHQKGIIHRDIKPANIIIDATGQPKVLDFGVARAIDSDIYFTTIQTDIGNLVGTIPYMSPEQVAGDSRNIDTRSDIYALGVLGYELLTNQLPYDLTHKAIPEAVRIIGHEDPTPISNINKTYRGDIETILSKALEKDQHLRYQSAAQLAADIRHYLHNQPIVARPPSVMYHLRKFTARHKEFTVGIIVVVFTLCGALANMTWERNRARDAEHLAESRRLEAESQRVEAEAQANKSLAMNEFLQQTLSSVDPETTLGREVTFRAFLDLIATRAESVLSDQPEVYASVRQTLGRTYRNLGFYEKAESNLRLALTERQRLLGEQHPQTFTTLNDLALTLQEQGKLSEAEPLFRRLLAIQRNTLGEEDTRTILAMNNLGWLLQSQSKLKEALELYNESLALRRKVSGEDHPEALRTMINLAGVFQNLGQLEQAESVSRQAVEGCQRVLGMEHPTTLYSIRMRVWLLMLMERIDEAEILAEQSLMLDRKILGDDHPHTFYSINNLAAVLMKAKRFPEAEILYRELLQSRIEKIGEEHPDTISTIGNVALSLRNQGKLHDAESYYLKSYHLSQRVMGMGNILTLRTMSILGSVYEEMDRFEDAESLITNALSIQRQQLGDSHPNTLLSMHNLATIYLRSGKALLAEPLFYKVYHTYLSTNGEKHSQTLLSMRGYVATLIKLNKFKEAEPLAILCCERYIKFYGPNRAGSRQALELLIDLYQGWGKPDKAAEFQSKHFQLYGVQMDP